MKHSVRAEDGERAGAGVDIHVRRLPLWLELLCACDGLRQVNSQGPAVARAVPGIVEIEDEGEEAPVAVRAANVVEVCAVRSVRCEAGAPSTRA